MKSRHFLMIFFITSLLFFGQFIPMGNIPSDTQYSVQTAVSICNGKFSLDPALQLQNLKIGRSGNYYSQYGIGYAALFIPAALIAKYLSSFFPHSYVLACLVSGTNTIMASLIILLMLHLFLQLGYSKKISLLSSIMIATGSLLLPYSKIIHAEIPTLLIVLLFISRFHIEKELSVKSGLIFGTLAASLLLLKIGNIIYSLCIISTALIYLKKRCFTVKGLLTLAIIPLGTVLLMMLFNKYRYSSFFDFGYGTEQTMFTTSLPYGLMMLLFSPSKSLFLFSPLVIPSGFGMINYYKKSPCLVIIMTLMFLGNLFFYALWHDWHGGWSWGPRLLVPSIILVHFFLPEFILQIKKSKLFRALFWAMLVPGILLNFLGASIWYQQIYYFHKDYHSYTNSHPVIAAKLFFHKISQDNEIYSCTYMNIDCEHDYFQSSWSEICKGATVDFSSFETFQGFAVFWSTLGVILKIKFLWLIPAFLSTIVVSAALFLWRVPIVPE